jgi:hypothetical protein
MNSIDKLIDEIATLVDKRQNEEFHINAETAIAMIAEMIENYVEDIIYDLSRTRIGNKYPYGDLVRFYRLPKEYKYLHAKKWEDMTPEEQAISYKSIPAARLEPM